MSSKNQIKIVDNHVDKLIETLYPNLSYHHHYKIYTNYLQHFNQTVPTEIINDLKNKKRTFCFNLAGEAEYSFVDQIYKDLIIYHNIPESQVLLICSSPDYKYYILDKSKVYNKDPIPTLYCSIFEHQQKQLFLWYMMGSDGQELLDIKVPYKSSLHNSKFSKKYICFNRRWKEHRFAVLSLLYNRNLLKDGYVSFSDKPVVSDDIYYNHSDAFEKMCDDTIKLFTKTEKELRLGFQFKKLLPLVIDNKVFQTYFAHDSSHRPLMKYYKDTYFSLVNETFYKSGSVRFLTEKLFRPIMHKHPFILASTPYSLQLLRDQGYKTFDGIIDETYDTVLDDDARLELIINEVEKLCSLNEKELDNFKNECLPIVEYNYNVFFTKQIEIKRLI